MKTGKSSAPIKTGIIKLIILTIVIAWINLSEFIFIIEIIVGFFLMAIHAPENVAVVISLACLPIFNLIPSIVLLDSLKLWLCSIPVQLIFYYLINYFISKVSWSSFWILMLILLAIQALGFGIKLIYRKTKSKKSGS